MKKSPSNYNLEYLMNSPILRSTQAEINGKWGPARPEGLYSFVERVRLAWGVFTGRLDTVTWPEGQ